MKKFGIISVALAALSFNLCAQETEKSVEEIDAYGYWDYGLRLGITSIDDLTARSEGIDESAYIVGLDVDYTKSNWVTTFTLDILVYDDNAKFSQEVEGTGLFNDGERSRASSSATGGFISIGTGYQWIADEGGTIALRAQGGFGAVVYSERSISNCSNCRSEDIDVDGGAFVKLSADKDFGTVTVGIFAQQFLGGDGLDNIYGLRFSSGF
ncbi:hypothetical protein [Agaribacter marinus]|uniref:Outer membrane protein beta-barrel domain-containing protein n=1 Tax=Agaribacter marinus TaxID=1431249 RepID=A0AA37SZ32_9ALTE|nr:hypothetical protein [Agaribacter marinus]GLR70541.1 hypothetical protein GCM10007852_14490 [Agaribacter marinus]